MDANIKVTEKLDDNGKPQVTISSDKIAAKFIVFKSENGFPFFSIRSTNGSIADELSGQYTKLQWAVDATVHYLEVAKPSATVARDIRSSARVKEKQELAAQGKE